MMAANPDDVTPRILNSLERCSLTRGLVLRTALVST